jgi:uncharacterized protein
MATIHNIADGMSDIISKIANWRQGQGAVSYHIPLSAAVIENAYLGSGMMRKCINIPADDSVRDWREWETESADIELLEQEEKRLDLQNVIRRLEVLRGLGGGALIMGLPGEPSEPAPDSIKRGQLLYVHIVNRYQLTIGDMIDDPTQDGYGGPSFYRMRTTKGDVTIHPSRVVTFKGGEIPCLQNTKSWDDMFWGESKVAALKNDVENYETVKSSLLRMVSKAAYMRVGIPHLGETLANAGGEARVSARVQTIASGATTLDAVVYDRGDGTDGEDISDATIQLAGIVETINGYGAQIAAVSDIPITRLFGKSATGLSSSGDSEQRDWNKTISARQSLLIDPCLSQIDKYLFQSAGIASASYKWPSLSQPSQKEDADRFLVIMTAVEKLQATASIPEEALAKGLQSLMMEEGWLPGLGNALAEIPEAERFGIEQPAQSEVDPSALTQPIAAE